MTLKTRLILDLLDDAYRIDGDMSAACGRMIERNQIAIRRSRKVARTSSSAGLRAMSTKCADRVVRQNRRIRDLARTYSWTI